jgi:hypothetical protein
MKPFSTPSLAAHWPGHAYWLPARTLSRPRRDVHSRFGLAGYRGMKVVLALKGPGPFDRARLERFVEQLEHSERRAAEALPEYTDQLIRARVRAHPTSPSFELLGLPHPTAHHALLYYAQEALAAGREMLAAEGKRARAAASREVLGRRGRFGQALFTDIHLALFEAIGEAAHLPAPRRRRRGGRRPPRPCILFHGRSEQSRAYSIGEHHPRCLREREHDVLQAFLKVAPALDAPQLAKATNRSAEDAVDALKGLAEKYDRIFAAAIHFPPKGAGEKGRKCSGGYHVCIHEASA